MSAEKAVRPCVAAVLAVLALAASVPAFAAGSESSYKAALAAAQAAERQAGVLKTQWTTTEEELEAAQKEAAAGDFDTATALAKHAQALANASIAQSKQQKKLWKNAEIR